METIVEDYVLCFGDGTYLVNLTDRDWLMTSGAIQNAFGVENLDLAEKLVKIMKLRAIKFPSRQNTDDYANVKIQKRKSIISDVNNARNEYANEITKIIEIENDILSKTNLGTEFKFKLFSKFLVQYPLKNYIVFVMNSHSRGYGLTNEVEEINDFLSYCTDLSNKSIAVIDGHDNQRNFLCCFVVDDFSLLKERIFLDKLTGKAFMKTMVYDIKTKKIVVVTDIA